MRKLKTHVMLRENKLVMPVSFGPNTPESDFPEWALEQLEGKDHLFEDAAPRGEVHLPAPKDAKPVSGVIPGSGPVTEPAATELGRPTVVPDEDDEDDEGAPPRRNASKPEWSAWAKDNGVPVTSDMSRDDIIKAAEEAGVL